MLKETLKKDEYDTFKLYKWCGGRDTSCSYFKALVYEVKGNKEKAIENWKKYLAKVPEGGFSKQANEHLEKLEGIKQ